MNQPPAQNGDVAILQGVRLCMRWEPHSSGRPPGFFRNQPIEARTLLAMQRDASALLERLLAGGHTIIASRLAGAFRNVGRDREAVAILSALTAAGYKVREIDPFAAQLPVTPYRRDPSPYVNRIRLLWAKMRQDIPDRFPPPGKVNDLDSYMKAVDEVYVTDAYHSLSIEGYRVSRELIERVRSGGWNPEGDEADRAQRDAMAARGYWQAFTAVKDSVRAVLAGENSGQVADRDQPAWYRASSSRPASAQA